ncbi:MAG TPA: NADH-quinone oxidoreductase subunit L [Candidatus Hydrogenedentes bacterium]|nr:NADH-quinone oxidoreductase subunit L [Candidatus Hydrogenedentota bacterium]HRT19174.1 NADH-quinone oxidoreductase subunit L [Candidatus Hydrogenedentota bacterium]HRT64103.1 NADH-quinone oxidoreductase subunit L [Candidatus Hydrogenedentota bacterium]
MLDALWLIPALPLAGFLILALGGGRMRRSTIAWVGCGSVGLSAAIAFMIAYRFIATPPEGHAYTQLLWTWMSVDGLAPRIALHLDALSLIMILVVAGVGFLIHVYSTEYMADDPAYARFFAYMNLFVASMLILVLADNLVLLYLGWEGVGVCSFLLIGFWYDNPANGRAALKAFLVTRIGDTAMILGLFLLYWHLHTLDIQELMARARHDWQPGMFAPMLAAAFLLGGAVGKSGQLPLQVWLPDAMAGPTPVSALIHAATMVTAGVYLIARTHVVFELAPAVQTAVAAIGAITLLLAGSAALVQRDIKRILAYSTISQIGYMFLALGVGAWSAAIFHLFTHAFFKALLFMAAGAIIISLHHEQDIFRMGGLRAKLPFVFWTFLIGAASLASMPFVTSGFYSKDLILYNAWMSQHGGAIFWAAGWFGAFLTAIYTFRMVFITFFGEAHGHVHSQPRLPMRLTLGALAVLATVAGFLEIPPTLGNWPAFTHFMSSALPEAHAGHASLAAEWGLQIAAIATVLAGLAVAYVLFLRRPQLVKAWCETPWGASLHALLTVGWGFDWIYDRLFVRPFNGIAHVNRNDFIDSFYTFVAYAAAGGNRLMVKTETGNLRWYMAAIAIGAAATTALVVFL